jgi:hypothetical protein
VLGKILENDQHGFGFDAQNEGYVNLMSKGIIDPRLCALHCRVLHPSRAYSSPRKRWLPSCRRSNPLRRPCLVPARISQFRAKTRKLKGADRSWCLNRLLLATMSVCPD